mmetsp:Transcript_5045/g.8658  ORF Transcript_5045/g.8658 Transcript_5045/m.8658 type:complete len:710 (+) Transcript_5045:62-2191(+)
MGSLGHNGYGPDRISVSASVAPFMDRITSRLRGLMDLMDKLQDLGLDAVIKLPKVAVVGEQSTGKSSVLESLVGEDFLPKGSELATRCPVQLRLVRDPAVEGFSAKLGVTLNDLKPVEMRDLPETIRALTSQIAGKDLNIVETPIWVEIRSSNTCDLSLTDLPGIAKNKLKGSDQPENIEEVTTNLIQRYIQDKETVILAVVPANIDVAASDAIKLSKRNDPEGNRTIGVLTKVDIMDRGTSAKKILQGDYIDLKLGFIRVKNRSQADVDNHVSVRDALRTESEFFSKHEVYKSMDPALFGAGNLAKKLMKISEKTLSEVLPELKDKVAAKLREVEEALQELGSGVPDDRPGRKMLCMTLMQTTAESINTFVMSRLPLHLQNVLREQDGVERADEDKDEYEVLGIAKIHDLFENFAKKVRSIDLDKLLGPAELARQIRNSRALELPGFLSFEMFKDLFKIPLKALDDPTRTVLADVHQYVLGVSYKLVDQSLAAFPQLQVLVQQVIEEYMGELKSSTDRKLYDLLKRQRHTFTTNPSYYSATQATPGKEKAVSAPTAVPAQSWGSFGTQPERIYSNPSPEYQIESAVYQVDNRCLMSTQGMPSYTNASAPAVTATDSQVSSLRHKLHTYFKIVTDIVCDEVPKTIVTELLDNFSAELHRRCVAKLFERDHPEEMVEETFDIADRRKKLLKQRKILNEASLLLSSSILPR